MPWTKKLSAAPNQAIMAPPSAGPMTFIKLKPPELSAIALARSRFGTTLGIMLIRTGSVIVQATPVISVKKKNMPNI